MSALTAVPIGRLALVGPYVGEVRAMPISPAEPVYHVD
jgi:hypothetical protein